LEPGVEESQHVEYKAADALAQTDGKKTEITKDVSAFANADGGVLIYGIAESDDTPPKPERFDPINAAVFSREWLAQVILNVQPRIPGLTIHPVAVQGGYVFVLEIPQSTTAHQARDLRYHRRWNTIVQAMPDHEIRDIMHRGTTPIVEPVFGVRKDGEPRTGTDGHNKQWLQVAVKNTGPVAVLNLKLKFSFPDFDTMPQSVNTSGPQLERVHGAQQKAINVIGRDQPGISIRVGERYELLVECRSSQVLFPDDILDFSGMQFEFLTSTQIVANVARSFRPENFTWKLYADDMPPLTGVVPLDDLITYGSDRLSNHRKFVRND